MHSIKFSCLALPPKMNHLSAAVKVQRAVIWREERFRAASQANKDQVFWSVSVVVELRPDPRKVATSQAP